MAPRLILNKNRHKFAIIHNNINVKKLNRSLIINAQLRKRILLLSNQNKELSMARNNLLLHKLTLEKENNSIKNSNIQLTAMLSTVCKKLSVLEQTLQKCVPALITLSHCVPSMMEDVHDMSKLNKVNEFNIKEKKEKQTKAVKPMINGLTITTRPSVILPKFDMSTIIESPNSEQTPKRRSKSSNRNSYSNVSLEPYVRLKDVAFMLKNSKGVSNVNSPKRQSPENLGEGPSWLYSQENQIHNFNSENSVIENTENPLVVSNEMSTLVTNETLTPNEVQTDMSSSTFTTSSGRISNTFHETGMNCSEIMSPVESSVLRNVTCRKRQRRNSSNESIISDTNDSISSSRSRRSTVKPPNYKEPSTKTKLRNEK